MKQNLNPAHLKREHAGFSLIEMMVAVGIAGILLAIAIPNVTTWLSQARLATTSDQLVESLSLAKQEAIKRRSTVSVCAATTPNTATACSGTASDWSKGWIVLAGTTVLNRYTAPSNLTISTDSNVNSGTTATFTTVTFGATVGFLSAPTLAGTGTQVACLQMTMTGGMTQRIEVIPSGRIVKSFNGTCV
ncbi:GspH/FimT family pseudopilin [Leeia sp. TBRC 13508]|uniref:Type II secretion system protein H n=1 Tax=Leeia speluncae TaxID=2884804 RepID=A0ABS8D5W4_9NEIS|nr:GspH/FimT family pseudopilin [Leeia speluncae]MCB6183557.1 GspH/FimT family pseudopilin [Leeia speluncae]